MSEVDWNLAVTKQLHEDSPLANAKTEVTVRFLLEIHNLAPIGSEIRARVIEAISHAAQRDNKSHWARGLIQTDAGTLVFHDIRYLHAVYQGKQDTYAKSAQQAFDELRRALEMVAVAQDRECVAIKEAAMRAPVGKPLVDLTTPTTSAALLKAAAAGLPAFVDRLAGGMEVAIRDSSHETPSCIASEIQCTSYVVISPATPTASGDDNCE